MNPSLLNTPPHAAIVTPRWGTGGRVSGGAFVLRAEAKPRLGRHGAAGRGPGLGSGVARRASALATTHRVVRIGA